MMKILFLYNFLQLFYKCLAAEFFMDINSKLMQFTVFLPNKFEIMGRKTFLVNDFGEKILPLENSLKIVG